MKHKELRQLLDAMIRPAKLSFERAGNLQAFAMTMNEQGKITQLVLPDRQRSEDETIKSIEAGLKLVAQQLTCEAVGLRSEIRLSGFAEMQVVFILEHRDGSAYRVMVPDFLDPKHWDAKRTESRFFQRMNSFSASTRW